MADPHASTSRAAMRCPNTIHSDYVRDHQCQMRRGHDGDCLFGDRDILRARILKLIRDTSEPQAFRIMRAILAADERGHSGDAA